MASIVAVGERVGHQLYSFNLGVPSDATITGIEVGVSGIKDATIYDYGTDILTSVSSDGGVTWPPNAIGDPDRRGCGATLCGTWTNGSPTDLWGRSWTPADFTNNRFRIKLECDPGSLVPPASLHCSADYAKVRIFYNCGPSSSYSFVNLNPGGAGLEDANDINDGGQIVGRGEVSGHTRALLWNATGTIQELGVLPGHVDSIALGINEGGAVVGRSDDGAGDFGAFLWTSSIGMQDIGSLGGSVTIAEDVNDLGWVVGRSGNSDHAFLYDGTIHDLGSLGGLSYGFSINNTSQIVGATQVSYLDNTWRAFRYNGAAGMQDLGTLGGPSSWAHDINNIGQVVGFAQAVYSGPYRAFLYDSEGMRDLSSLPGTNYCEAFGINDTGHVVGYCGSPGFDATRAFIWRPDTGMQDLNSLVNLPPGWILHQARAINGAGQIVGVGTYYGSLAGFLLTPR